ncbi:hypothetical protein WN943_007709 [Citrus x changshan-huyou]
MGLEINEKQVGLSEQLKKISGLTTVERLKASTQIARDSATLNVFTLFVMRIEKHGSTSSRTSLSSFFYNSAFLLFKKAPDWNHMLHVTNGKANL